MGALAKQPRDWAVDPNQFGKDPNCQFAIPKNHADGADVMIARTQHNLAVTWRAAARQAAAERGERFTNEWMANQIDGIEKGSLYKILAGRQVLRLDQYIAISARFPVETDPPVLPAFVDWSGLPPLTEERIVQSVRNYRRQRKREGF